LTCWGKDISIAAAGGGASVMSMMVTILRYHCGYAKRFRQPGGIFLR
jgi:hypothetical protein